MVTPQLAHPSQCRLNQVSFLRVEDFTRRSLPIKQPYYTPLETATNHDDLSRGQAQTVAKNH